MIKNGKKRVYFYITNEIIKFSRCMLLFDMYFQLEIHIKKA